MNKKYTAPVMSIVEFAHENIVMASSILNAFTKGLYNSTAGQGNWKSEWSTSQDNLSFE